MRGLAKKRQLARQVTGSFEVDVPGEGADRKPAVVRTDAGHSFHSADVDDKAGLGESELEERDKALTTGHHLGRVTVLSEQRQRFIE